MEFLVEAGLLEPTSANLTETEEPVLPGGYQELRSEDAFHLAYT